MQAWSYIAILHFCHAQSQGWITLRGRSAMQKKPSSLFLCWPCLKSWSHLMRFALVQSWPLLHPLAKQTKSVKAWKAWKAWLQNELGLLRWLYVTQPIFSREHVFEAQHSPPRDATCDSSRWRVLSTSSKVLSQVTLGQIAKSEGLPKIIVIHKIHSFHDIFLQKVHESSLFMQSINSYKNTGKLRRFARVSTVNLCCEAKQTFPASHVMFDVAPFQNHPACDASLATTWGLWSYVRSEGFAIQHRKQMY